MDEIIRPTKQSIAPASVKQEGEKNLYIENNNGGVVNINYSPSQQLQGISAEQIIAIQNSVSNIINSSSLVILIFLIQI